MHTGGLGMFMGRAGLLWAWLGLSARSWKAGLTQPMREEGDMVWGGWVGGERNPGLPAKAQPD